MDPCGTLPNVFKFSSYKMGASTNSRLLADIPLFIYGKGAKSFNLADVSDIFYFFRFGGGEKKEASEQAAGGGFFTENTGEAFSHSPSSSFFLAIISLPLLPSQQISLHLLLCPCVSPLHRDRAVIIEHPPVFCSCALETKGGI